MQGTSNDGDTALSASRFWRERELSQRKIPVSARLKALAWKLLTVPLVGLVCFVVTSEGLRMLMPALGMKLYRLPVPLFSHLRDFEGFHRLDVAHLFSILLYIAVWVLWKVNLSILFAPQEFFTRTRFNPEAFTKLARGLGIVVLGADALLFYCGVTSQMGGIFGGSGFFISAVLATIAYVGVIIFVSFVSVYLER